MECEYEAIRLDGNRRCPTCAGKINKWKETCLRCKKRVNQHEEGVECVNCETWYHRDCEQVDAKLYKELKEKEGKIWLCSFKNCDTEAMKNIRQMKMQQADYKDLLKENMILKDQVEAMKVDKEEVENKMEEVQRKMNDHAAAWELDKEQMTNKVIQFEKILEEKRANEKEESLLSLDNKNEGKEEMKMILDQIKNLQANFDKKIQDRKEEVEKVTGEIRNMNENFDRKFQAFTTKWEAMEEELVRKVTQKVIESFEEKDDRDKRKKNLVLFNVPESRKEDREERTQEDKELCEKIFKETLGIRGLELEQVHRLGWREVGKKEH